MDAAERVQNDAVGQRPGSVDHAPDEGPAVDGVSLADLRPLTTLHVRTANSLYRIIVLRGSTVLVQGGRSFPEMTRGNLFSFGSNALRVAWIGVGLRMEIHSGKRRILTSPVRAFTIEPRPSRVAAA